MYAAAAQSGEFVLDRPTAEGENADRDQLADSGDEIEERQRPVIAGLDEDAPEQPDVEGYKERDDREFGDEGRQAIQQNFMISVA